MCKSQTSVSHSSTESEIISLDAGLRMDGLLILDLWDVVIEVLRSTHNTKRPIWLAPGNWCGTGNHSSNKTKTKTPTSWVSGNRDGERSNRDVDQLSYVNYVPANTHFSQGESHVCQSLKMTKLWSRWSSKDEVQKWDMYPEPTELRLIGCLTGSTLTPKSESNVLTPRTNSKTCWPKRVSRVMSGIIFFVCATIFLIRPESRVACQREDKKWLPVKVGSPMAKARPMNSAVAKSRPTHLVLHSPLSARKNPSQDLSDPVNPRNVDEERGGHSTSADNPSQDAIEHSQVRRQENTQHADFWKQEDRVDSSGSTSTRKLVREVNTKNEFHNMRIWNHLYLTKVFQHLHKKEVVNHNGLLNFCNGSNEDQCIDVEIVHIFVSESSHSSWTKLFGNFRSTQEHKLRGSLEFIQYQTEADIRTFWRDSECEHNWKYIFLMDEIDIVSWTSYPVDKKQKYDKMGRSSGIILNDRFFR